MGGFGAENRVPRCILFFSPRCIFSISLPPVSFYPIMFHMPGISQPKPSPRWGCGAEIAARCELVQVEVGRMQGPVWFT